jgi:hypothetical protein
VTSIRTPDHGSQSRYKGSKHGNWDPCRCPLCKAAHNRACHQRALAHSAGQPPLYPCEPLVRHIETLEAAGMSRDLIARQAEVSHSTIKYIAIGLTKRCRRAAALRILAVSPSDFDLQARHPTLGSRRRVQALYAIGHNHEVIGATAALSASSVSKLANGHSQYLDARTVDAVRRAYAELSVTAGASDKARSLATQRGWPGPAYWDDDDFENPNFVPALTDTSGLKKVDVKHLLRCGVANEEVKARTGASIAYIRDTAARLGVTKNHLQQALKRHPDTERAAA